jgi:NhaP-type Na+/H+ or K+/H+ antiporter
MADVLISEAGILLLLSLLIISMIIGHILRSQGCKFLQESGIALILGFLAGLILLGVGHLTSSQTYLTFNLDNFMCVILTPIIFNSSYNINKVMLT